MKQAISTEKVPVTGSPYSAGMRAGDFVFVSGQIPMDGQTKTIPDGIEAQTRQALENVKAVLEASGATMGDVVKVSVVLTDMADFGAMNEVYRTYFSDPLPARITYGGMLARPEMVVEIDAVAYTGR